MKHLKLFESFNDEIKDIEYYKLVGSATAFDPYDVKQIQTYNPNFKISQGEGTKNLPLSLKTTGKITYVFIRQLNDKSFLVETLGPDLSKFYHVLNIDSLYQLLKSLDLVKT
jgi:hypothetical protein